jgi:hypothetical protein
MSLTSPSSLRNLPSSLETDLHSVPLLLASVQALDASNRVLESLLLLCKGPNVVGREPGGVDRRPRAGGLGGRPSYLRFAGDG